MASNPIEVAPGDKAYKTKDRQPLCEDNKSKDGEEMDSLVIIPDIPPADCEADDEFKHMFQYKLTKELSGDDKLDRITLLLSDQFVLENGKLYRLDTPKRKSISKLVQLRIRLCVPTKFQNEIICFAHDAKGHYALHRVFLTLSSLSIIGKSSIMTLQSLTRHVKHANGVSETVHIDQPTSLDRSGRKFWSGLDVRL